MKKYIWLALVLSLFAIVPSTSGCAPTPPPGTYTDLGLRNQKADVVLNDLLAVSKTAINLNATAGKLHLSDVDTRAVRDAALTVGAAVKSYAAGANTLQAASDALVVLNNKFSQEARVNPTLRATLLVLSQALAALPQ